MAFDDEDDYPDDGYSDAYERYAETVSVDIHDDRAFITIELDDGSVMHLGDHGGVSLDWLEQYWDDWGDDMWDQIVDELWDEMYG